MKDGGVGDGIFVGTTRSRAVVVHVVVGHDGEVEVSEEGRVLVNVCEASGGKCERMIVKVEGMKLFFYATSGARGDPSAVGYLW